MNLLNYGPLHAATAFAMTKMRQDIAQAEAILATRKEELAHFEEGFERLLGITDPATVPNVNNQLAAQAAQTANLAADPDNSNIGGAAGTGAGVSTVEQAQATEQTVVN